MRCIFQIQLEQIHFYHIHHTSCDELCATHLKRLGQPCLFFFLHFSAFRYLIVVVAIEAVLIWHIVTCIYHVYIQFVSHWKQTKNTDRMTFTAAIICDKVYGAVYIFASLLSKNVRLVICCRRFSVHFYHNYMNIYENPSVFYAKDRMFFCHDIYCPFFNQN